MLTRFRNKLRNVPASASLWRLAQRVKEDAFGLHHKRLFDLQLLENGTQQLRKRALFSYIVHPFSIPPNDSAFLRHSNICHAQEIVRVLNELGYIVDVIDFRDTSFVPKRKYDMFIGHGGLNVRAIAAWLPDETVKIYFSTGCYWKYHNEQELARFKALYDRKAVNLPLDRYINNGEEEALLSVDGIIGIGNHFTRRTYADFSPVVMINGTALPDNHYDESEKDFERGGQHLLYYAGSGCVHKGLDLLLEVFANVDQHLWICSTIDNEFAAAYSDVLKGHSNIHLMGWVQPRSPQFYQLMDTCNSVLLPSCSEGQAQSVVECMIHGLIPVVSQASGISIDHFGVIIEPCSIEKIASTVRSMAKWPARKCRKMSLGSRKAAQILFSREMFATNMRDAILRIVDATSRRRGTQSLCRANRSPS